MRAPDIHSVDIGYRPFNQNPEVKFRRRHAATWTPGQRMSSRMSTWGKLQAISRCSFQATFQDLVFAHGDYCLPNVILKDGKVRFIDWVGLVWRTGIRHPLGVRSLRHNHYPEDLVTVFLEAYGITDPISKIEYFILLEFFRGCHSRPHSFRVIVQLRLTHPVNVSWLAA